MNKTSKLSYQALLIIVIIAFLVVMFLLNREKALSILAGEDYQVSLIQDTSTPTRDPYANCLHWSSALESYRKTCVYGQIDHIEYEYDEPSHSDVWYAHFGKDTNNDFVLISVDFDLSKYDRKCVLVVGYVSNGKMVNVEVGPDGEVGFKIYLPEKNLCK